MTVFMEIRPTFKHLLRDIFMHCPPKYVSGSLLAVGCQAVTSKVNT